MILCDIDGVLANFSLGAQRLMSDCPGVQYSHPKECPKWDWMEEKEERLLWERVEATPYFWYNLDALPEALSAIRAYLPARNVLYTTSRKRIGTTEAQTGAWLRAHSLDGTYVLRADKARLAKLLRPAFAIEDHPDKMLAIARTGTLVFAPLYPYNAHVVHENIRRYETLDQVFKIEEEPCHDAQSCLR